MKIITFSQNFKETPNNYLKKQNENEMKKYRPVSNLSFISKILQKVVANRLQAHIIIPIYLIHITGVIILQNQLY